MKRSVIRQAVMAAVAVLFASWASAEEYFTGDGGAGKSISVERPKVQNVGDDVSWLPDYANNVISDDIKKYSHIEVVERRYEAAVSSALAHEEGAEYADDGVEVGNFKAAKSQLQVSIIGKGTSYNVSVTVIDKSTLTSQASFNEDCGYATLESGAVLGKAVASLLGQLGVNLTDKAKGELLTSANAVSKQSIEAQKLVAKAQQAQAAGQNIEALRLSMAASRQDASLERAAVTKTRVSQAVSSGDMGANVRNAIKRRDEMAGLIEETKEYYAKNPPYMVVYDPELTQGDINYSDRTFEVMFDVALIMSPNVAEDYIMIREALEADPEWKNWGLNLADIFSDYRVLFDASILNAKGSIVASKKMTIGADMSEQVVFREDNKSEHNRIEVYAKKITQREKKVYTVYNVFGNITGHTDISADKETDGLVLRVDSASSTDNGTPIACFTVSNYCTSVWQRYLDADSSLPPGINMFNWHFISSKGRAAPVKMQTQAFAANTRATGWKKGSDADLYATMYFDYYKKTHRNNGHYETLSYIKGFVAGADEGHKSIALPRTICQDLVVEIFPNAFSGEKTIESIEIFEVGNNMHSCLIGSHAFANCTSLVTVMIHKDAKLLFGKDVFKGCTSLSEESKADIMAAGYKGKF